MARLGFCDEALVGEAVQDLGRANAAAHHGVERSGFVGAVELVVLGGQGVEVAEHARAAETAAGAAAAPPRPEEASVWG